MKYWVGSLTCVSIGKMLFLVHLCIPRSLFPKKRDTIKRRRRRQKDTLYIMAVGVSLPIDVVEKSMHNCVRACYAHNMTEWAGKMSPLPSSLYVMMCWGAKERLLATQLLTCLSIVCLHASELLLLACMCARLPRTGVMCASPSLIFP